MSAVTLGREILFTPLKRPGLGTPLLVRYDNGAVHSVPVEKVVGQYTYVDGMRFHVLDDRISDLSWRLPGRKCTFVMEDDVA